MKRILMAAVMALAPVWGQTLTFNFDALAAKAKEKVEVDLDGNLLLELAKAAPEKAEILKNVQRVMVRTFEFEQDGAYTDADIEAVRKQVNGVAGWSRVINVREGKEITEIYVYSQGGSPAGFLLIAAEAKELTVVHIGGAIQLAQLQEVVSSTMKFDLAALK